MALQNETPPLGAAGLGNLSCLPADVPSNTRNPAAVQEAIFLLKREFVAERLRIAAIKANHAADNLVVRDDFCAERDIRIAVENIREAARSFRELEQLTAGARHD